MQILHLVSVSSPSHFLIRVLYLSGTHVYVPVYSYLDGNFKLLFINKGRKLKPQNWLFLKPVSSFAFLLLSSSVFRVKFYAQIVNIKSHKDITEKK